MAAKQQPLPDLGNLMEQRVLVHIKGGRQVSGVLRGYDQFMNLVLESAKDDSNRPGCDSGADIGKTVIRGNIVKDIELTV